MKGKFFLTITSILIIVGAIAGFVLLSIYTSPIPKPAGFAACGFLLATGIIGIIERCKHARICIVLGTILLTLSIASIPAMFVLGKGSVSLGLLLSALASIVVFGFYLNGATMNKRSEHSDVYTFIR